MIRSIIATLAGLAIAAPASATSWADINELQDLVTGTGTKIQNLDCPEGQMGFYQFDKANKIDRLVYCKNNVDMTDPDAVWEVLVHEATHVMQSLLRRTCHERHLRTPVCSVSCRKLLLTTMSTLQQYRGDHKRVEIEAFWMELRTPSVPMDWMVTYCYQE